MADVRTFAGSGGSSIAMSNLTHHRKVSESGPLKPGPESTPAIESPVIEDDNDFHGDAIGSLKLSRAFSGEQPKPAPNSTKSSGTFHGNGTGSLNLSAADNKVPESPSEFSVRGGRAGSLLLSDVASTNPTNEAANKLIHGGASSGSVVLSEVVSAGKLPEPVVDVQPGNFAVHGIPAGSLILSQVVSEGNKLASAPENEAAVIYGNAIGSLKLSQASTTAPVSDLTPIEDILKSIAEQYEWSDEELQHDISAFKKYRIKNAKQARDLSIQAWNEMDQLLSTTKDFIRAAVGWIEH